MKKRARRDSSARRSSKRARVDAAESSDRRAAPYDSDKTALVLARIEALEATRRPADPSSAKSSLQRAQSIAGQCIVPVLKHIFRDVQQQMLDATLIPLPMQAINPDRQSHITNAGNKRFSHGEIVAFKHAMCKQKMLELGTVCRNWRSAASEMYPRDYFFIGEKQVKVGSALLNVDQADVSMRRNISCSPCRRCGDYSSRRSRSHVIS